MTTNRQRASSSRDPYSCVDVASSCYTTKYARADTYSSLTMLHHKRQSERNQTIIVSPASDEAGTVRAKSDDYRLPSLRQSRNSSTDRPAKKKKTKKKKHRKLPMYTAAGEPLERSRGSHAT